MKKIIIISILSILGTITLKAQSKLELDHIFIVIDTTNNIHLKLEKKV